LLILPSDIHKENTARCTAIDKSGTFILNSTAFVVFFSSIISFVLGDFTSHKPGTPTLSRGNSPLINDAQVSNVSQTGSLQSSGQFEFEDLPTWTVLSDEGSVTPHNSDGERHRVNYNDIDSDVADDEVLPRKRQKTQTGSIIGKTPIATVKSWDTIIIDGGGSRKRKLPRLQTFATPTDTRVTHVAIPNPESSPTTTISSNVQGNSTPTRKKLNGLCGLVVPRPLAMSKSTSTSDSLNSGVLKDLSRKTRGQAHGTNSKKSSQGYVADQHELESWTNADIAHTTFRKPDELKVLCELEEQDTKRNVSHIFKSFMETESSNRNVARNEGIILNCIQNPVAIPDSSFYTRCDDLVEEIYGPDSRKRGTKTKMVPSLFFYFEVELMICV
jgi:hypothetical protein